MRKTSEFVMEKKNVERKINDSEVVRVAFASAIARQHRVVCTHQVARCCFMAGQPTLHRKSVLYRA